MARAPRVSFRSAAPDQTPGPRSRGCRCRLPPITSVTPRAPPANTLATRSAARPPPSRRTPSSTRPSPRHWRRSPRAWTRSASKSELYPHACGARRRLQPRVAAPLAGEPAAGLAALLAKYLGVTLAKEHQKADWSRRPLPPAMLAYAAADTQHLPALREGLRSRLAALQRLAWAEEEFTRLEDLRWTATPDGGGPDAFLRVKGAKALPPRQLAALRELYRWREAVAAEQDRATFRIIGNDALLAVARALPRSRAELERVDQVPPALGARHGAALLDAVRRTLDLDEADLPHVERTPRTPRDPSVEARVERLKAARNRVAQELGLEPGVLCGRSTLEAVARAAPLPNDRAGLARIGELRRWQIEALGDALLAALV